MRTAPEPVRTSRASSPSADRRGASARRSITAVADADHPARPGAATSASWVISTMVRPDACSSSSRPSTSAVDAESRLPVGSSARISAGSVTSARATATRCCWPPDSSPGRCSTRSPSPTRSSAAIARLRALGPRARRRSISGSSTLRHADIDGSRLNCWNTKPICRLRTSASSILGHRADVLAGQAGSARRSGRRGSR